jgi:hypothetical protein
LCIYNNELYAAGRFTSGGGNNVNRIARWNGTDWLDLGLGLNDIARSMAVYNSELVVGGSFITAGGISVNRIAKWNGSSWSQLGLGVNDDVNALALVNGELFVGGAFTAVGGVSVDRIAKWTGSWSGVGIGMNNIVNSLVNFNGQLLAGGNFTSAGGIGANRIAGWNGSSWYALSSGMTGAAPVQVLTIAVYNTVPYAGGNFDNAGGTIVNNTARWSNPTGISVISNEVPGSFKLFQNYPNPFNPETSFKFQVAKYGNVKIIVYDITGQLISEIVNREMEPGTYSMIFYASGLSSGVYYYQLSAGGFVESRKMILSK